MGMIKDRNSKDLTEAEEIKKRWQEYPEAPTGYMLCQHVFSSAQHRSPSLPVDQQSPSQQISNVFMC